MCLPEYDLSVFGLHCTIGGVRSSHASSWFLEWIGVPQSVSLLEMGAGRWLDTLSRDQDMAVAVQLQWVEVDGEVPRNSGFSGGGSGGGCSWASCPPRFRSDGGDGAVAVLVGSDTATLSVLDYAGLCSQSWTLLIYALLCLDSSLRLPHCMGFYPIDDFETSFEP